MINSNFWKSKRVFVTGHTGFMGSWLCLWLHSLGATVYGYSLSVPTNPSLFEESKLDQIITSELGDVRDLDRLMGAMQNFKPDIVFHLAAQSLVHLSYELPIETYSTNVLGLVNLLEAVRQVKHIRAVINVSSDKCYENREWEWGYRESEAMGGFDPYGSSKGCAELITASYRQSFFNPENYQQHRCGIASVRAGNVIGGGDWATNRLIPDLLEAFSRKQTVKIRCPQAFRPWQHVLVPLSGYISVAEKLYSEGPAFAEAWNFGPREDDTKSVQWIVEKMVAQWGDGAGWHMDNHSYPHEAHHLKLDCSKARIKLGWQPVWGLEQTLHRIINWYKAWLNKADMYEYTLFEIKDYMNAQGDL